MEVSGARMFPVRRRPMRNGVLFAAMLAWCVVLVVSSVSWGIHLPNWTSQMNAFSDVKCPRGFLMANSSGASRRTLSVQSESNRVVSLSKNPVLDVFYLAKYPATYENSFEMHEILDRLDRPIRFHEPGDLDIVSNSLILARSDDDSRVLEKAIAVIREKELQNVGLFHVGNEMGDAGSLYEVFSYVVRSYYHSGLWKQCEGKSLVWVPLGHKDDLGPIQSSALLPAPQRSIACSFMGGTGVTTQRKDARRILKQVHEKMGSPCLFELKDRFGGDREQDIHYYRVIRDSVFTLCPSGNTDETIRFYDALESGSIPVIVQDKAHGRHEYVEYIEQLTGKLPAVVLDRWEDLEKLLESAVQSPESVQRTQLEVLSAWTALKEMQVQKLTSIMNQSV